MRTVEQQYEPEFAIANLREHEQNPNRGDDNAVGELIDANGFYGAVIVQRSTGRIIAGNTRYRAARAKGAETMPVLLVDVDDDEALRIMLGDNRARDLAATNTEGLVQLLDVLSQSGRGLQGTGFQAPDLDNLLTVLGHNDTEPGGGLGDVQDWLSLERLTIECEKELATRFREVEGETDRDKLATLIDGYQDGS